MKKQLRECKSQNEIRERLKTNAGLIKENNHSEEEELLDLEGFTKKSLKDMIRVEVRDYFEETFEGDTKIDEEDDIELQKIINELEKEFS